MTLLASLLIELVGRRSAARFEETTRDPAAAQEELLRQMMEANRDTE